MGHRGIKDILLDEVLVEEKVDGSQFSFGVFYDAAGEEVLKIRSKGAQISEFAPDSMFAKAVATVELLRPLLVHGWTYRCEYLNRAKHNVLAYDRFPEKHIILFDVTTGMETYLSREDKEVEAARLGLEVVPLLFRGAITDVNQFRALLDNVSILGGQKVEGVVVKNYARFGIDGKAMIGKFVSELFKEVHAGEWRSANPTTGDILAGLVAKYRTPARWAKARQHLLEAGQLTHEPKDIGLLIPEIQNDLEAECADEIKAALWKWAWPHLRRAVAGGAPEWYKEELLKSQFEEQPR
jgi:hypothetical protein